LPIEVEQDRIAQSADRGEARRVDISLLSKSLKHPLEEQDAQADHRQRDTGGGSYSQDLVHAHLHLEAPTP
jgi:hypothetical protein